MGVRKTVFASVSERENFQKLSRQWGDEYRIYHNLPFLNVLEPKNIFTLWKWPIEQMVIPEIDLNRLKKTSLDYTLCDEQDTPILSIEFDGMEEGYNAGTAYHTDLPGSAWRKHMMELKLQVAHGSFYPFFVVGTDEFRDFASDIKLTIVDGIIGEVLSKRATHDLLAKGFHPEEYGMTNEEFGALPQERQNFYIEDFVFSAETMGEMTHNPIFRQLEQLRAEIPGCGVSLRPLTSGDDTSKSGWQADLKLPDGTPVTAKLWMPKFNAPNYSGIGLEMEIARLLALSKAKELMKAGKR